MGRAWHKCVSLEKSRQDLAGDLTWPHTAHARNEATRIDLPDHCGSGTRAAFDLDREIVARASDDAPIEPSPTNLNLYFRTNRCVHHTHQPHSTQRNIRCLINMRPGTDRHDNGQCTAKPFVAPQSRPLDADGNGGDKDDHIVPAPIERDDAGILQRPVASEGNKNAEDGQAEQYTERD